MNTLENISPSAGVCIKYTECILYDAGVRAAVNVIPMILGIPKCILFTITGEGQVSHHSAYRVVLYKKKNSVFLFFLETFF